MKSSQVLAASINNITIIFNDRNLVAERKRKSLVMKH